MLILLQDYLLYYLLIINVVGGIVFWSDKQKAEKNKYRIPEKTLHIFELLGSVFFILFLMYFARHKNRKSSYYLWTYLFMAVWLGLLYLIYIHYFV